ncbi:hypothetical protein J14TS2_46670 [Bacillus sp. J14TS2]|uniref:CPBP family intramembrane glutamic endopeptidase n=1 Tax=Bacillus sp. J14TS2 TaxID=2807188 RepID=UPI001B126E85|nr:CPBP family intramembrane glutamic endopeptidase [Bacillus sp. J14TS2]GIN74192.1 hypothetical protein J14TS2_46670 [Bacillus sp. J14TS2]
MSNKIKRSKMVIIVIVYYIVTLFAAGFFGVIQPSTAIPNEVIQLTQFGPTLGVVIVILLFRGDSLQITFGFRFNSNSLRNLLIVLASIVFVFAIAVGWYRIWGVSVGFVHPADLSNPFWLIIIAQFIGAAGEEFGWRCFLQPFLHTRLRMLNASMLVGLLWGIWHVGIFSEGFMFAGLFILSTVSMSVFLGEVLNRAKGNHLILAVSFHALMNLGMLLLFDEENGSLFAMAALAGAVTILALCSLVFRWNKFSRQGRPDYLVIPRK